MSRALYNLAWLVGLPLAIGRLLWRSVREPAYRSGIAQRLATADGAADYQGAWWIHAVSVGETRAAQPLVEALLEEDAEAKVLLTQMTPTGQRTARDLYARYGARVKTAYLPYDLPVLARRFLNAYRPRAGVLMETEIWPNFILEARSAGIPVVLANARLSERSARGYARLGKLTRRVLASLSAVAAQSADDAARLARLGAVSPEVTGSMKFDVRPTPETPARTAELTAMLGDRRVLLAASTREGEEQDILRAFAAQADETHLLLLVPRHPQRFDLVEGLIEEAGLSLQRRSSASPVAAATRVLLGDSMGEMFAYYSVAAAALIGGSWQALGGQNLIEACAVGTPVVTGPHTFNFTEVTELAIAAGAAQRAQDVEVGMARLIAIAGDDALRARMSAAGSAFAQAHRGATARTVRVLRRALDTPTGD